MTVAVFVIVLVGVFVKVDVSTKVDVGKAVPPIGEGVLVGVEVGVLETVGVLIGV